MRGPLSFEREETMADSNDKKHLGEDDFKLDASPAQAEGKQGGKGGKTALAILGAAAAVALCAALGFFGYKAVSSGLDAQMQTPSQQEQASGQSAEFTDNAASKKAKEASKKDKAAAAEEECDHEWETVYEDVKRPAVYKDVTTYHTVCNTCKEIIDGKTQEHAEETGHEGYTTGVPGTEKKLVKKAYTEEVATKKVCELCGEEKALEH